MVLFRWEPGAFGLTGWGLFWAWVSGSALCGAIATRGRSKSG